MSTQIHTQDAIRTLTNAFAPMNCLIMAARKGCFSFTLVNEHGIARHSERLYPDQYSSAEPLQAVIERTRQALVAWNARKAETPKALPEKQGFLLVFHELPGKTLLILMKKGSAISVTVRHPLDDLDSIVFAFQLARMHQPANTANDAPPVPPQSFGNQDQGRYSALMSMAHAIASRVMANPRRYLASTVFWVQPSSSGPSSTLGWPPADLPCGPVAPAFSGLRFT
jgi:hypothetical protein